MEQVDEPAGGVQKPPKKKGAARETLYRVTMQNQIEGYEKTEDISDA